MSDVKYTVEVDFKQSGSIDAGLGISNATQKLSGLASKFNAVSSAAGQFNGMLDSIGGAIAGISMSAATGIGTALAGGFAMAVREAFKFNEQMENTQISIANMASANGIAGSFQGAFRLAGDTMVQMRKDARELPGEFKDLASIMGSMTPAAANAGIGMPGIEKMAAKVMVVASMVDGLSMKTAGNEMGALLSGDARHNMPMVRALGITDTKAFNKLDQKQRTAVLNEHLDKSNTPEALERIKGSWEVIKSTAIDSVRQSTAAIGGPMFVAVKDIVAKFNELGKGENGDRNRERWTMFAWKLGDDLKKVFDYGVTGVEHWYGPISTFLGTMERGFARTFGGAEGTIARMKARLDLFMNDPAAFSKLEHIVKEMVGLRLAGGAVEKGAGLVGSALGAAPGLKAMGIDLAAIEGLGLAAAGVGVALGVLALSVKGVFDILTDGGNKWHSWAETNLDVMKDAFGKLGESAKGLGDSLKPVSDALGADLLFSISKVSIALMFLVGAIDIASKGLGDKLSFGNPLDKVKQKLDERDPANAAEAKFNAELKADLDKSKNDYLMTNMRNVGVANPWQNAGAEREMDAHKPPVHNTTIHKVEIKVNSNQDPSRIAKRTADLLLDLSRHPQVARGGPPQFSKT